MHRSDYDRFGGWTGRTFDATGFFQTEKEERWWLVTPDGNAFLSFGINHLHAYWWKQAYNRRAWQTRLRLEDLDGQLSELHQLARKHRVEPEDLAQKLGSLQDRLSRAEQADTVEQDLKNAVDRAEKQYRKKAAEVSSRRQKAAKRLAADVTGRILRSELIRAL